MKDKDIVFKYAGTRWTSLYDTVIDQYGNENFSIKIEENTDLNECMIVVKNRV